jgi:signal peptidase I
MPNETTSRSWWSTALVSFFSGPFGGFLWIGRGTLALFSLVVMSLAGLYLCYSGLPILPGLDLDIQSAVALSNIGAGILSVFLVVPLAGRFKPTRWYSHGLSVLVLAGLVTWLVAFGIRSFLVQPFSIPAGSMNPTLMEGDHLFVSKVAYGYSRYSVPFGLLPIEGRLFGKEPERGDIAVFKPPQDPAFDYIKRIVGLPGEKIQMIGGVLHINDVPVPLDEIGPYIAEEIEVNSARLQRETLPNGVSYEIINLTDDSFGDDTRPFIVPARHYFMLGDNRDNSMDSRFNVGAVPYENLVGRAVRLFWNSRGIDYSARQSLSGASTRD